MKHGLAVIAGVVTVALSAACGPAEQTESGGVQYQPAATAPQPAAAPTAATPTPTPTPAAAPVATAAPQPPAAAEPMPPMAAGAAGGAATARPPAMGSGNEGSGEADEATPDPSAGAGRTRRGSPTASAAGSAAEPPSSGASTDPAAPASGSGFDAGSGEMQADGKTIIYRIPDGTGGNDWNKKSEPIRAKRGMTVRLIDEDKSTRSGGHWLHTYGQPCPHSARAIGTGYDCVIGQKAPLGIVSGVAEHNIGNGIGHLYIEVVE